MSVAKKTVEDQLRDAQEIIRRKNAELTASKKEVARLHRENDTAESIRDRIYELAEYSPLPETWQIKEGGAGKRGMPMTCWSDWHYGEVINPDEVGGVNSFDNKIAAKRVKRLVSTTVDLAYNHMGKAKTSYPGVVIMLGGDMIGGDIHEELAKTNDKTPQQAVNEVTDLLADAIQTMADKFGSVWLPAVVGNHGRSTKRLQMKQRVFTSYEWNIYCNLDRAFRKDKNIHFYIPAGADAFFTVYGHRFFLTHGDSLGVKGGDGIIGAIGPIMRGTIKTHRSEAQIGRDFDTAVICHWHQYLTLPGLIVNNSLKGYDEFARLALRAPYSRPSQALWFCHPEHGITAHWQVYLEALAKAEEHKQLITWAA